MAKMLSLVEEALPLDGPMVEANPKWLASHVEQIDEKHDQAHERLRLDFRELEARFNVATDQISNLRTAVDGLQNKRVDVTALSLSPGTAVAIIMVVLAVAGWAIQMQSTMTANFERAFKAQELQRIQLESLAKNVIELTAKKQP